MLIYILRHGQTDYNKNGIFQGRNNISLNEEGIKQITETSKELKKIKFDKIYVSPLKRTIETAKIININNKNIIYDNRILERDTKKMMYHNFQDVDHNYFYNLKYDIIYEDCEGFKSVFTRVANFIEDIKKHYKNKTILVVTHGDVCKAIYSYLNHISDISEIINFQQDNGEVLYYEI